MIDPQVQYGLPRKELGVHYPVDILGGILMAAGIALVCKFNVLPILF
jgi:membrane-associated phospholipid phosphatase